MARWANSGKLHVYRLLVSNDNVPFWNIQSIEHTGSLPNLYVNILRAEEYDSIEHDFDVMFESPAKAAFDKICNNEKMTSDDWVKVSDYICAQYVRTPAFYLWIKEWGAKNLPDQINEVGEKLKNLKSIPRDNRPHSPEAELLPIGVQLTEEKPDDNHTFIEISAVSGKGLWLFFIKHTLSESSDIRRYFRDLKWSIIMAPDGEYWPTCDNPVVICDLNDNSIKKSPDASGIAGKTKAILIPVSPQIVLLATHTRKYNWRFKADNPLAQDIRNAIIKNAMLYVYSIKDDMSIPLVRPRIVDEKEYKRLKDDFDNWFENYKNIEGPLLNRS